MNIFIQTRVSPRSNAWRLLFKRILKPARPLSKKYYCISWYRQERGKGTDPSNIYHTLSCASSLPGCTIHSYSSWSFSARVPNSSRSQFIIIRAAMEGKKFRQTFFNVNKWMYEYSLRQAFNSQSFITSSSPWHIISKHLVFHGVLASITPSILETNNKSKPTSLSTGNAHVLVQHVCCQWQIYDSITLRKKRSESSIY